MIVNKTWILGFLVKDPEANEKYCRFTIAVRRDYKNQEGNYDNDFIRCVAFNQTAKFISNYFKKGDLISIEGSITTSKYEKDGKVQYNTEIMVSKASFVPSKTNNTSKKENGLKEPKNEFEQNVKELDLGW